MAIVRRAADETLEERPARYAGLLRGGRWLLALIVIPLTATVLVLSLALPKTYESTARMVLGDGAGTPTPASADTTRRRLATIRTLLTSHDVLSRAARTLPGETAGTLTDKVTAKVEGGANIVDVTAADHDPRRAATIANGVARTYIREGIATGGSLQIAQPARTPAHATSPKPIQNTVFALFASTFLGVLAVLARERFSPRVSGPRELTARIGARPLVVMPDPHRRGARRQVDDAFEALQETLRVQLGAHQRVVMVTSPLGREGASAVTSGLAQALAAAGQPTLVVAADLRRAEQPLGVARAPGLTDALARARSGDPVPVEELLRDAASPGWAALHVLPSGTAASAPAGLLSIASLGTVISQLRHTRHRYVLVDGPPLVGPVDGQLVAHCVDAVLVVTRPEALTPEAATDLGDVLRRLRAPVLGTIMVGAGRTVVYGLGAPGRRASLAARA